MAARFLPYAFFMLFSLILSYLETFFIVFFVSFYFILAFLTCEERTRVYWGTGKAPQRLNASIRHMHRGHSAYSNPTCALRAPFALHTFHSCFDLCRASEGNTRTPDEHSVDNPNVLTKQPTRNAMHACEMTLAYLGGGLSTCFVVWVEFEYFSLTFIEILMQLCKHFL